MFCYDMYIRLVNCGFSLIDRSRPGQDGHGAVGMYLQANNASVKQISLMANVISIDQCQYFPPASSV